MTPQRMVNGAGLCVGVAVCLAWGNALLGAALAQPEAVEQAPVSLTDNQPNTAPRFDPTQLKLQSSAAAILRFDVPKVSADLPSARFGIFDLLVLDKGSHWQIVVALDPSILAGDYLIYFNDAPNAAQGKAIPLTIVAHSQPAAGQSAPAPVVSARPSWPRALLALNFLNSSEPKLPFVTAVEKPLEPRMTRIEQIRSVTRQATGLVLSQDAMRQLTAQGLDDGAIPLVAPSQGIVANLLESQGSPTLLILDHGRSLISLFAFNGEPQVDIGAGVEQGQLLANIRLTEPANNTAQPDLIWWVSVNGAILSPQQFIDWDVIRANARG